MPKSKFLKSRSGKVCQLSGKKAQTGRKYSFLRSHYNPTVKRRFEVNLQTIRTFNENGRPVKLKLAVSTIKRCPGIKQGIKSYLKRNKERRLKRQEKEELLNTVKKLYEGQESPNSQQAAQQS